jgi:hypothetical protein
LAQLGFEHYLVLTYDEANCQQLKLVLPGFGCAWDTFSHPQDLNGKMLLWNSRYRVLLR